MEKEATLCAYTNLMTGEEGYIWADGETEQVVSRCFVSSGVAWMTKPAGYSRYTILCPLEAAR